MRTLVKTIGAAVLVAALIAGNQARACTPVASNVLAPRWPIVGEVLRFPHAGPYGCIGGPEELRRTWILQMKDNAQWLTKIGCSRLQADADYIILEAQQFNDAAYYRVVFEEFDVSTPDPTAPPKKDDSVWIMIDHPQMRPVMVCQ